MNQKILNLIIAITFFSLIASTALALDYISLNPQAEAPVVCDANREGSIYYGFPGNVIYVCDSTLNWSSMGAEGNISPLTVTTTDGLLYLNDPGQEGSIYQTNYIYGYNDLHIWSDPTNSATIYLDAANDEIEFYTLGTEKMKIDSSGNLIVNNLNAANCDVKADTSGVLSCGIDDDTDADSVIGNEVFEITASTGIARTGTKATGYTLSADCTAILGHSCGSDNTDDNVDSGELDNLCPTDNKILKRISGNWVCDDDATGSTDCSSCDTRFVNTTGDTMTGMLSINTVGNDKIRLRGTQIAPHTIWLGDDKGVRFWDEDNGELMRITNTGNVGIRTTDPTAKLSIITSTGSVWTHGDLSGNIGLDIGKDGAGNVGSIKMWSYNSGNYVFLRPSNGNYHIDSTTGQYYYNWDEGVRTTNNGIIHMADEAGNEDIRLSTAGNSWFNGGRVGIGTASPNQPLTIYRPGVSAGVYGNWKNDDEEILIGVDNSGGIVSTMSNHDLQLRAGGNSTKMTIRADGNILIAEGYVEFPTVDYRGGSYGPTSQTILRLPANADGANIISRQLSGDIHEIVLQMYDNNTGDAFKIWFDDYRGDSYDRYPLEVRGDRVLLVQDNGKVGIGTVDPGAPLEISSTQDGILRLRQNEAGTPWNYIEFYNDSTRQWYLGQDSNGTFRISDKLVIKTDGSVGIGTTNPSGHMLDVASVRGSTGNSAIRALYPGGGGLTGTEFGALAHRNGQWNAVYARAGSAGAALYTDGEVNMMNGNVGIGTTNPHGPLEISDSSDANPGYTYWRKVYSNYGNDLYYNTGAPVHYGFEDETCDIYSGAWQYTYTSCGVNESKTCIDSYTNEFGTYYHAHVTCRKEYKFEATQVAGWE